MVAAEEVPAALVLLGGQRLRMRKVILLVVLLRRPGRVGLPLLLLFCDAVAAGRERRRQTVQVVDVCKGAILENTIEQVF